MFGQSSVVKHIKPVMLDAKKIQLKEIGSLPKALKEASGLEITNDGHLWSHNDDGVPVLFCIDTLGKLVKTIQLDRANHGWEEITRDDEDNFYVAGIGNNKNDKKDLKILKFADPEKTPANKIAETEDISFKYEDQKDFPPPPRKLNFDADAMISLNGSLYIFTKNRTVPFTGYSKIYKLSQKAGEQTAALVDSLFLGKGYMLDRWITGAAVSPDKKTIAILFHDHIWLLRDFTAGKFSNSKIYEVNLNHYSHKAGICFLTNEKLYIVDELELDIIGGKLYSLDLRPVASDIK
jgi:hypothetical protein